VSPTTLWFGPPVGKQTQSVSHRISGNAVRK
jgi:hypothetical protein